MTKNHWNEHAKQWSYIAAPLRPCAEDIQIVEKYLHKNHAQNPHLKALLLGVTPELAKMQWPSKTHLLAIDKNQVMINEVWPQQTLNHLAEARQGDWLNLPCEDNSINVAVGDGCVTLLSYQNQYADFFKEISRVLSAQGAFVIRHFTRPQNTESIDTVFADLMAGRIGNFHVFKWRLAMALHGNIEEGIVVGEVWDVWNKKNIAVESLVAKFGWAKESINTINNYKYIDTVYTFPTVEEVTEISSVYFEQLDCRFLNYELGDRCPTFFLTPKNKR